MQYLAPSEDELDVDALVESVDIAEYISQYCDLEEKNGELWALSPLKDEKTPSFSVNPELQCFYDFSSGQGGNVISFIRAYNKCGFGTAVRMLREYLGPDKAAGDKPTGKLSAIKVLSRFQPKQRAEKQSTATVLPSDHMNLYSLSADKLKIWEDEGIARDVLLRHQVRYDPFANRLVFPIFRPNGEIINVCGRTLDPDFKAKKLRKYCYYQSLGVLDTMYGLYENKANIAQTREVIVFEGAKSVMLAETWGILNTVAILTSHLGPCQLKLLIDLGARVVFALDEDVDVRNDANIAKLKHFTEVEVVCNSDGLLAPKMAPVDAGLEAWKKLYERRRRLM